MANTSNGNVYRIDTTDTDLPAVRNICGIKYVGANSGTATVKAISSSRESLWEHAGDVIVHDDVKIRANQGIEVEVTNGVVVYIYTSVR